jgi:formylglycine-generating enzyme required for sulfatase activity
MAGDGREHPDDGEGRRVVRGGSWTAIADLARCAYRNDDVPGDRDNNLGFRVLCVSPIP